MKKFLFWVVFLPAIVFIGCNHDSRSGVVSPDAYTDSEGGGGDGGSGGSSSNGEGQGEAGVVTAGEWRDLDHWLFWSQLMTEKADQEGNDYSSLSSYWGLYTNHRVAVRVADAAGVAQRDVPIQLLSGDNVLYEARTDNKGEVSLWIGLTQQQNSVDEESLHLVVNGQRTDQAVSVTEWGEEVEWNSCTASITPSKNIDLAFIVDATGSMMDEIDFLKADLANIIHQVEARNVSADIRTAALFYRDEGDDYVTRESDFSSSLSVTTSFIAQQTADGGGDYPEAVHTALEKGLQALSWKEDNCMRLAFMFLDAPPHKRDDVINSLQRIIPQYAKAGIRIIPVAASGVDKNTEFFLRFTAIATDATYVFITNDSGVGNEHIEATVGEYTVEQLNDLIIRLIDQYMQ